jgi:hypothetical protein
VRVAAFRAKDPARHADHLLAVRIVAGCALLMLAAAWYVNQAK